MTEHPAEHEWIHPYQLGEIVRSQLTAEQEWAKWLCRFCLMPRPK